MKDWKKMVLALAAHAEDAGLNTAAAVLRAARTPENAHLACLDARAAGTGAHEVISHIGEMNRAMWDLNGDLAAFVRTVDQVDAACLAAIVADESTS